MTIREYKGALHLHTDLSHDGELTFEQLTSFLKGKGYDFITITDHSYDVKQADMDKLAQKAKEASTDDFLVIPGIEFRCKYDIDILGLGVYQTIESDDLGIVIDHIHANSGVAIFAHPNQESYIIEKNWVSKLDGVEIFNHKEGKLLPHISTIKLCNKMQKWHPKLNIHIGLDLHHLRGFMFLSTTVQADKNDRNEILDALKTGEFTNESAFFNVGSDGQLDTFYLLYIYLFRTVLNFIRWLRDILHI